MSETSTAASPSPNAKISTKLAALDALDKLADDPLGWFPERLMKLPTDARVAVIVDRWRDALVTLEEVYTALEEFIDKLQHGPEHDGARSRNDAVTQAKSELALCADVQAFVGKRSIDE